MTLLASERSLLIRNKFRSVLQLRIQNRRQQNEINSDAGVKSTCLSLLGEKERSEAVCLPEDSAAHKSPPSGLSRKPVNCTTQDWSDGAGQQQKRARLAEDLSEKIQRRPGPLELLQKHILPLETDVSEDDISCSSSSSSPEQLGIHQSPVFSASPGLTGDHSLNDLSPGPPPLSQSPNNFQCSLAMLPATEGISQPMTMTLFDSDSMASPGRTKGVLLTTQVTRLPPQTAQPPTTPPQSSLAPSASPSRPPRCKKPRDSKPKMKKLKYHQYIPPDQRGGAGGGTSGGSAQRGSTPVPPIDPAYSRLLQQQQVFLQLQILNQQQQQKQQQGLAVPPSGDPQKVRFTGASQPTCIQGSPKGTNSTPTDTNPNHKPELLPPNLDDLTVSELRQHLRKRGLPVSGTKPSLLDRLRPYQLPRPCLPPAPLCQLGSNMVAPAPTVLSNAHPDSHSNPPNIFIQSSNMLSKAGANGGDQAKTGVGFLTGTSSTATSLHPPSSHPLSSGTPWRPGQAAEEMSVEMEMRERLRSRPRERAHKVGSDVAGDSSGPLHPFLQQDTGCQRVNSETNGQPEVLFTQVFSCHPCDVIGQDFELPMQITASPAQVPSSGRSLEEELQEAIQRVQMAPSQSIEDILDEPLTCADTVSSVSELHAAVAALSGPSPSPLVDQPQQPSLHPSKDENFLSSPLCSSLLLELPPSPSNVPQLAPPPPPPPPPICTTPPATAVSRKRREAATFDPADWLESLTSCLRPLTPPAAPFVETDFGLDSDLSVNRVLDLIVEQW